jgi:hypothetical protein
MRVRQFRRQSGFDDIDAHALPMPFAKRRDIPEIGAQVGEKFR